MAEYCGNRRVMSVAEHERFNDTVSMGAQRDVTGGWKKSVCRRGWITIFLFIAYRKPLVSVKCIIIDFLLSSANVFHTVYGFGEPHAAWSKRTTRYSSPLNTRGRLLIPSTVCSFISICFHFFFFLTRCGRT